MATIDNSLIYPKNPGTVAAQARPVQWGGMVKGALIITGVVVAAVAGYWLATGGVDLIAQAIGGNSVVGPALTDAWNWMGNTLGWVGGQLQGAASWIGAQFSGAAGTATAGMATGPVAPAVVDSASKAAGVIGALGGGVLAAKHIATLPVMTDHGSAMVAAAPVPAPSPDMAMDHSNAILPQKKAAIHASMSDLGHDGHVLHNAADLPDMPDMPDEMLAAKSTASKIVHHAGEHAHESWANRMAKKAAAASHTHAVLEGRAATSATESRIPEPKATYLADLEDSRSKLDAALAKA